MRNLITILLFCIVVPIKAQEILKKDFSTSIPTESDLKTGNIKAPDTEANISLQLHDYKLLKTSPLFEPNLNLNFNNHIYDLEHGFSYMLYNSTNVLKGIGSQYEAGGIFIYRPGNNFTLSFGTSGLKYSINGQSYNDFLFFANMTYQFNHWLRLHVYGQYTLNSQVNSLSGGYYLSPQNSYGAVLMIKIADQKKYSVDMNIGAERSYNPLNNKWEMNYRLGPEIRLK